MTSYQKLKTKFINAKKYKGMYKRANKRTGKVLFLALVGWGIVIVELFI